VIAPTAVAVVVVVVVVTLVAVSVKRATTAVEGSVRRYVELLDRGPGAAWASLCSTARDGIDEESFRLRVKELSPVSHADIRGVARTWPWSRTRTVFLELTTGELDQILVAFPVADEHGWRVCPVGLAAVDGVEP
jgi:hypothetical protein